MEVKRNIGNFRSHFFRSQTTLILANPDINFRVDLLSRVKSGTRGFVKNLRNFQKLMLANTNLHIY